MSHTCVTCTRTATQKCIACNIPFCNTACQRTHHLYYSLCGGGVKRDRSPEPEPEENTVDLLYLQAVAVVRKSGNCNMIMDLDCVFIGMLCVLNMWGKHREGSAIVGNNEEILKIMRAWREITKEQRASIDESIEGMPYSGEYIDAVTQRWNNDKVTPELVEYLKQHDYHEGSNWAKFLVDFAKEQCMLRGMFLRDKVKLESLKGVFDINELTIAGAQFPKGRV